MLVLSATYMSPFSELISGSELKMLLERTINFLEKSRNISPTLRRDAEILRNTYVKIFHAEPPSPGTSTAATSAT